MDTREFLNRFIDFKRCSKLSLTNVYCTHSRRISNDIGEGGGGEYFLKLDPLTEASTRGNITSIVFSFFLFFFFQLLLKTDKDKETYKVVKEHLRIFNF